MNCQKDMHCMRGKDKRANRGFRRWNKFESGQEQKEGDIIIICSWTVSVCWVEIVPFSGRESGSCPLGPQMRSCPDAYCGPRNLLIWPKSKSVHWWPFVAPVLCPSVHLICSCPVLLSSFAWSSKFPEACMVAGETRQQICHHIANVSNLERCGDMPGLGLSDRFVVSFWRSYVISEVYASNRNSSHRWIISILNGWALVYLVLGKIVREVLNLLHFC